MKVLFLSAVLLAAAPVYSAPVEVSLAQCRSVLGDLSAIHTDAQARGLMAAMTAGDEMQLSTRLAACVSQHSGSLSPADINQLNLFAYKLDADVMARMWSFIESRHLGDAFND